MKILLVGLFAVALLVPVAYGQYYYTDCHGVYGFNLIVCRLHVEIHKLNSTIEDLTEENRDLRQRASVAADRVPASAPAGSTDWLPIKAQSEDHYNLNKVAVKLEQNKHDRGVFKIYFNTGARAANVVYSIELWDGGSSPQERIWFKESEGIGYAQFDQDGHANDIRVCITEVNGRDIEQARNTDPFQNAHAECTSFGNVRLGEDGGQRN